MTKVRHIGSHRGAHPARGCAPPWPSLARAGLLALALAVLSPARTLAATDAGTPLSGITLTVQATCLVAAAPAPSTTVTGPAGIDLRTISITCTNTTFFSVALAVDGPRPPVVTGPGPGPGAGGLLSYAVFVQPGPNPPANPPSGTDTVFGVGSGTPMVFTVTSHAAPTPSADPSKSRFVITATVTF